jgi:Icc-related predicted phosphoesterase
MKRNSDGRPLRLILVSDLHYSLQPSRREDDSRVFQWLHNVVENEKPDLVISAGDFGEDAHSPELFNLILERANLLTIHGNHDNLKLIKRLKNVDGSSCWLQDGTIRDINGIRIAGVNGNMAQTKRSPHHKTVEEVNELISQYSKIGHIDMLVAHEAPTHTQLARNGRSLGQEVLAKAIDELEPKLYLCGHIHIESQIIRVNETMLINVDSSMRHQEYATCTYQSGEFGNFQIKKSLPRSARTMTLKGLSPSPATLTLTPP